MTPTPLAPPGRNHPSGATPVCDPQLKVRPQMYQLVTRVHQARIWYQKHKKMHLNCHELQCGFTAASFVDVNVRMLDIFIGPVSGSIWEHADAELRIMFTYFDNVQRVIWTVHFKFGCQVKSNRKRNTLES